MTVRYMCGKEVNVLCANFACMGGRVRWWVGGGSEDEKPAKVLMKESLCEALFCLESGSKLWKAIW